MATDTPTQENEVTESQEQTDAPARQRPGSVPVDFAQAQQEQKDEDAATAATDKPEDELPSEILEMLAPKRGAKQWEFGKDKEGNSLRHYTQRELSVVAKAQWFSLVGEALEKVMKGDNPLSLNTILQPPESVRGFATGGAISASDFQDADMFIAAISKMLIHMPDFLSKSVCIWLSVPDFEWDMMNDLMKMSPELGGLSDDMFNTMVEIFIDQNYETIRANFRERWPNLRLRWIQRAKEADDSHSRRR